MKHLRLLALLAALVCLLPLTVAAQSPRDIGVFGDPAGTVTYGDVAGYTPFFLYVVGFDLDGLVFGFEAEMVNPIGYFDPANNPGGITVLSAVFAGPAPLNVGNNHNFIVGTGGCVDGMGTFVVASYNLGYFAGPSAPGDLTFCLTPSTPSSFEPAAPGYLQCDGSLVPFGAVASGNAFYPDGCWVGNAQSDPPVETTVQSFGAVKAGF